uniref:Clade I nitrous oxide reductase n=1 Tax=Macrostomum lignano TaxID=282301 RepID=A0A1I8FMK1_9PLAT
IPEKQSGQSAKPGQQSGASRARPEELRHRRRLPRRQLAHAQMCGQNLRQVEVASASQLNGLALRCRWPALQEVETFRNV